MPDDEPDRNAHSPQLDQPTRSRERAALDIAVEALRYWNETMPFGSKAATVALDKIAALVPEAVKP